MPLLHVQAGSVDQLQDIADALWKARKVVVITGAGISTNSGIPDFRSENGLYSMIQSQFDAAAKLGAPKAEISGTASDERPRKRRKTSPPIEDSIEVAPEISEAPAPPLERDTIQVAGPRGDESKGSEADTNQLSVTNDGDLPTKAVSEMEDCNGETTDQVEDEVVLLSEESVLESEHSISNPRDGRDANDDAQEEVPDPPSISQNNSKSYVSMDEPRKTPAAASIAITTVHDFKHAKSPLQSSSSDSKPLENKKPLHFSQAGQNTSHPSGLSTPKPASIPGPQTTSSSPLSSPPPAELFDSLYEPLNEPPSSSTRPSSPVSTEDAQDDKDEDEDDSEPSFSQDFLNRSSTFKRSLSTLKGKELFDASIWSDPLKTSVFYTFATNLRQKSRDASPTGCHQFIGHLSKAGKMVRCYTQNIDLLEDKVGLSTRLLLGAGSRSRFSTRVSKGVTAGTGGSGTRTPCNNNVQQPTVTPVSCPEASMPQQAIGGQNGSQEASPTNCQGKPSQLAEEVDIDHQQTSTTYRELIEGDGTQNAELGAEAERDGAKADAQPVAASLIEPEKPLPAADRGNSPEHDRGVECVFLHGSLRALRCFQCGCVTDWDDGRELQTMSGQQPPCPRCEDATVARQERGKRALGVGKLRPDIVLYGEDHPESQQISSIIQHDISLAPDMLIIMGTSLKVHGLKTVVREFAKTVHNRKDGKVIFVNYTKPAESVWADIIDFWVEMDCDSWVEDLKEKKPIIWLPPGSVEADPRNTNPKRRRTLNEDMEKKEVKKSKKAEKVTNTANAPPAKDKGKARQIDKPESPTDAKPYVPKRPAAHRDCKQNAAYWTTKIVADLARMTGRVVAPGPPPYRAAQSTQSTSLPLTDATTQSSVSIKVRRGPRTKNTRSKVLEAAATPDVSAKPTSTVKEDKPPSVAKAPSKRRPKSIGGTRATAHDTSCTNNPVSCKQDTDGRLDDNVLAEVPVPNGGPHNEGEDIPMVAAVKNRVRKPKVFFGDTDPPSTAPTRRVTPLTGNVRSKSKAAPQAKHSKAIKSEQTPSPDEMESATAETRSTHMRILPVPHSRPQPTVTIPHRSPELHGGITLAPLRPSDRKATKSRPTPFLQMALVQSEPTDSASPPPDFLEPIVSPGPLDRSPQMSPNHWRKRAFSYGNALSRHFETPCRNLDFTNLRGGDAGDPAYMEYPRRVPPTGQQLGLAEAPPLLIGAPPVPILTPPVEPLSAPDSPNRQLHRESEAAAALTQMAAYDHRQFARI
ncbi:NAD-dependent deacetylase hst3 [Gnomoniopsis sp. IMI 355080]|nr:NAD-dependent deacetylase hst3 [Gnomoniopsis sp. IMI 355080]